MVQVNKTPGEMPSRAELAADARSLIRRALKASLATLDAKTGYPYASLITVATDGSGAPVFLISALARHTQNLVHDARASILVDGTGGLGDPLQGARISLFGQAQKTDDEAVKRRFLARHEEAAFYAGFPDFSFWRLAVEGAHYVGGFGRIVDFARAQLLIDTDGAKPLLEAEPEILEHMNQDHADAIQLYATKLLGGADGPWRMVGCDPEGCDLLYGDRALRLTFDQPVTSPAEIRKALVHLVQLARSA